MSSDAADDRLRQWSDNWLRQRAASDVPGMSVREIASLMAEDVPADLMRQTLSAEYAQDRAESSNATSDDLRAWLEQRARLVEVVDCGCWRR